uniref:Olfactory receptor n=1 Tax=Denticeps clupeoides TaxID=299321 RepID=A0A8C4AFR1_9TELE
MENATLPAHFYLTLFSGVGPLRYPFFLLTVAVYFVVLLFNFSIILVIIREKSLHAPMYIFICCLSFNSLYGSAGLFPRLSVDLLSESHAISHAACFTQIFIIYTYAICELTILSIMAYDRYVAICHPLRYHSVMTPRTTSWLIAAALLWPLLCMAVVTFLTARLPLCGTQITRIYCATWAVARLSCVPTSSNSILGLFIATTNLVLPSAFILYTYVRILIVCRRSSPEFRGKALQTCLPHIVTFVNYVTASFCDIVLSRHELDRVLNVLAFIFSLEFLVIPPILNPLIYGLTLPEIRKKNMIFSPSPDSISTPT